MYELHNFSDLSLYGSCTYMYYLVSISYTTTLSFTCWTIQNTIRYSGNSHQSANIMARSQLNLISHILLTLKLSTGLLTQAVSQDVATRYCSHKLSSNCNTCRYTQPPVGLTGPAPGSHNHNNPLMTCH